MSHRLKLTAISRPCQSAVVIVVALKKAFKMILKAAPCQQLVN